MEKKDKPIACIVCRFCVQVQGKGSDRMVECDSVQGGGYFPASEVLEEGCRFFLEDTDYIEAHIRPAL